MTIEQKLIEEMATVHRISNGMISSRTLKGFRMPPLNEKESPVSRYPKIHRPVPDNTALGVRLATDSHRSKRAVLPSFWYPNRYPGVSWVDQSKVIGTLLIRY